MSTVQDVDFDDVPVLDYIDDEEVEDGNGSTVSHSEIADGPTLNNGRITILSHPASTDSPTGVNNLNSPIAANQAVANSLLAEEQEHFPIPNS